MKKDYNENNWSPFVPEWYKNAFDKFISNEEILDKINSIIEQEYCIPDSDGSKSSILRNEAIINNSFNENILRETLKDIYLNNSHRLVASNHDNTHFFQWNGHMSDMDLVRNTNYSQFSIPTESFIYPNERDRFKLSQLYRRWIKVEDILNNWDIFKCHCILFINQKVYSEYELRIDDHETIIKFKYYDHWVTNNYPVYIYKFDTKSQCRVLISKELCVNQWNWKMPVDYIKDTRVVNSKNIMVYFNKISDPDIRKDGLTNVEVIGDNIEFLSIDNGYIDLSKISNFNKIYIQSESTEWLWMSIMVPKFFHEYPILLPTESVYRPYEANFQPVLINSNNLIQHVKSRFDDMDKPRQVYVDINGRLEEDFDGWKQMIRPIVLSDAFDDTYVEPYDDLVVEIDNLRDLTVKGADIIEDFRFFLKEYTTDYEFNEFLKKILSIMYSIHEAHNTFLNHMMIEYNQLYESKYKKFQYVMKDIEETGVVNDWLEEKPEGSASEENDFWYMVSPLIYIPRELADKYYVINIITGITNKNLWSDIKSYIGEIRFRRPIEENDFWTFEYYQEDDVWRPYPLKITRHFPDVYLPVDESEKVPSLNRIFKTFFFYSDTMNVLDESGDIVRATPSWDKDINEYHIDQNANYRDIFMEKFYWMAVRSIYKGILKTKNRWEVIEYIIDNPSYERFNNLFLNTIDPYFKLGVVTYLRSTNYGFPFDDAIDKMKESIDSKFIGYDRITNFELYLNNSWLPSYFDYITKITDDWEYSDKLIRRPSTTFDIMRLLPKLLDLQKQILSSVNDVIETINWILDQLRNENYNLNVNGIEILKNLLIKICDNIEYVTNFTEGLNLQIYSIEDVNKIIDRLNMYTSDLSLLNEKLNAVYNDTDVNNIHEIKMDLINKMIVGIDSAEERIRTASGFVNDFDMDGFMKSINDLRSYFDHAKTNPDDKSLIGYINKFEDPWSNAVKEKRNNLFQSTAILYGTFDPQKSYSYKEIDDFIHTLNKVKSDISDLNNAIAEFCVNFNYEIDQVIITKLEYTEDFLSKLIVNTSEYMKSRNELLFDLEKIRNSILNMSGLNIGTTESGYARSIDDLTYDVESSLSYIAGSNDKNTALDKLSSIRELISKWIDFNKHEKDVFDTIFSISKSPVKFLESLMSHIDRIHTITEYMNTVNFTNTANNIITYRDVFEVLEIEIVTGGFDHTAGEYVFIPHLGSYKITDINTNNSSAIALRDTGYINTSFINPSGERSYDSITSGCGVGITVRPIVVKQTKIINDDVIHNIIMSINNLTYIIARDSTNANKYDNFSLKDDIDVIDHIKSLWDELDYCKDYISNNTRYYMDNIISIICSLGGYCDHIIEFRNRIDIEDIINSVGKLTEDVYNYMDDNKIINEEFSYYDNIFRLSVEPLKDFYGNGSKWSDSTKLISILSDLIMSLDSYNKNIVSNIPDISVDTIITTIKSTINNLKIFPNVRVDITMTINKINKLLSDMPDLQNDKWYSIYSIAIATSGEGYNIGDIVEVEDCGDVILLQVTHVEYGNVTQLKKLIDYAIRYPINGVKRTRKRVGNGSGLSVNITSCIVNSMNVSLNNNEQSIPFGENDMFAFKFENVHNLDVGYEVFIGGKQITDFYIEHVPRDIESNQKEIDVVYVNANDVIKLKKSSIHIPSQHYFVYGIDDIDIKDPGAGYSVGQSIYLKTGSIPIKLKVAELLDGPYKGISNVEISDMSINYCDYDPSNDNSEVSTDSLNNIDDEYNEGSYDLITIDGIIKPITKSLDKDEYNYTFRRFDNLSDGLRNKSFMYPDVDMPLTEDIPINGDPDYHWYQGNRIDNSKHPMVDNRRWNGIMNIIPPTDPFIPDNMRIPPNVNIKGEFHFICRERIHDSEMETNTDPTYVYNNSIRNSAMISGDLQVPHFSDLPKHINEYKAASVNKKIIVENDETYGGHRTLYRIRSFNPSGFIVYDIPELSDEKWNSIEVNWMDCDFYPDEPSIKSHFPEAPWRTAKTFRSIQEGIIDGKYNNEFEHIMRNNSTYIHNLNIDDLSVFNWTLKKWENLHDVNRWKLEIKNNDNKHEWGFKLIFIEKYEKSYSYDMMLFLNKIPDNQIRNSSLKKNAVMDVHAVIKEEVDIPGIDVFVNTGKNFIIRKILPYEQKQRFIIGKSIDGDPLGYEMNFKIKSYDKFRNEIHLEDITVYNISANRFENILDRSLFEVRFKDSTAVSRGFETQTNVINTLISQSGEGFVNGYVWGWNQEYNVHIFGEVTADMFGDGHIISFELQHYLNAPTENISIEFNVYQNDKQSDVQCAVIVVEFITERVEVWGDGYIHNVRNRLAVVPKEIKIIVQYDLNGPYEYEVGINKKYEGWEFSKPEWDITPVFHIDGYNIPSDRLYFLTDNGRYPLVNPSTGKPTFISTKTETGTDITLLSLYKKYEHIQIRSVPYPMRSVYVQRRIPVNGYINLDGKINKPLNKKYFEFWVNGKLLTDEVTIISPTKIILHGLKSLKNFEIIEINRDSNEYFSDLFLETTQSDLQRPIRKWNYSTYLDDALEGNLDGDNYTEDEQEYLLSPVWKQVDQNHPEFKNYPPNVDIEDDILLRSTSDDDLNIDNSSYQFFVLDPPTLEGRQISDHKLSFKHFGFKPITNEMLIDMMNEEWKEEINNNPFFPEHSIITDDEWYGMSTRLYDEYGILVHNLNESAYNITDSSVLRINRETNISRIVKNNITYDLD